MISHGESKPHFTLKACPWNTNKGSSRGDMTSVSLGFLYHSDLGMHYRVHLSTITPNCIRKWPKVKFGKTVYNHSKAFLDRHPIYLFPLSSLPSRTCACNTLTEASGSMKTAILSHNHHYLSTILWEHGLHQVGYMFPHLVLNNPYRLKYWDTQGSQTFSQAHNLSHAKPILESS